MKIVQFSEIANVIYNLIRKSKDLLYNPFDFLVTCLLLYMGGVKFKRINTSGIPVVRQNKKTGSSIIIGDNFRMNNGSRRNPLGFGSIKCSFIANGGSISIGDNTGISQTTILAIDADILIGDNVKIGAGVRIYSSDFHSLDFKRRRERSLDVLDRKSASITIGDDCFIGSGTIILKGVKIGDRSVIGANSVVTRNIPNDCVAAGNPCKIVKYLNTNNNYEIKS